GAIPAKRLLLVGLGKEKEFTLDRVRQVAGQAATRVRELGLKSFSSVALGAGLSSIDDEAAAQALTEGVLMSQYQFNTFKTVDRDKIKELEGFTLGEADARKL